MAKRKENSRRPQPRHKRKLGPSRFDKRRRLATPNPNRKKTVRARVPLIGELAAMAASMGGLLDARMGFRLAIIMAGMMLAGERRVAAAWFAAGGVQDDWDRFYDCLIGVGKRVDSVALPLLTTVLRKFDPGPEGRILLAGDDSPTRRFGPHVEGTGVHHHPTPGPADGEWLYGHNWVSLAMVVKHSLWGVIALPLRSMLYVRAANCPQWTEKYGWEFRTKHEQLIDLVAWFVETARGMGLRCAIWLAVDGAYAARPFLRAMGRWSVVVVSRLRKDAALFDFPEERAPGKRGRRPIYGKNRIHLAKRAAHQEGWESITYCCRGEDVTRPFKTFQATSHTAGGVIRVVIVKFETGWVPYFCTDSNAEVKDILEAASERWAIEEQFHDVKEVWGAGKQQVRNIWSNIACWNLNQWMYTLVELCSWDAPKADLVDRADRPWDNPNRRPSHADRRRAISRKMVEKQFLAHLPPSLNSRKIRRAISDMIRMAA